jgi:hypothetical protein
VPSVAGLGSRFALAERSVRWIARRFERPCPRVQGSTRGAQCGVRSCPSKEGHACLGITEPNGWMPSRCGDDAKIHTIFEGTSEIQQLVIARAISGLRIE